MNRSVRTGVLRTDIAMFIKRRKQPATAMLEHSCLSDSPTSRKLRGSIANFASGAPGPFRFVGTPTARVSKSRDARQRPRAIRAYAE